MESKEVFRYIGLIFFSIILILSLITAITATSARVFLNPSIYESAFEKSNAFETLAKSAIPQDSPQNIPSEELKNQGNQLIRNLLSYLKSETQTLNLTIVIQPSLIKSILAERVEKARVCNQNESPYISGKLVCKPSGVPNDVLVNQAFIEGGFSEDKPLIVDLGKMNGDNNAMFQDLRGYISGMQSAKIISWIVVIISLIAIFFLCSTYPSRMRWIGAPLIIAGIFLMGVVQGVAAAIDDALNNPQIAQVLQTVFKEIVKPFQSSMFIFSIISGILGILLFASSFFLKPKTK
ncbi:hypothetical protein FJZ18_02050 [Candidatus Pacearchaeota archaeon]|nr:hypothetical protein [Candidatus Pacearchaeota archaeon]